MTSQTWRTRRTPRFLLSVAEGLVVLFTETQVLKEQQTRDVQVAGDCGFITQESELGLSYSRFGTHQPRDVY